MKIMTMAQAAATVGTAHHRTNRPITKPAITAVGITGSVWFLGSAIY
jgi:hypothetical protein